LKANKKIENINYISKFFCQIKVILYVLTTGTNSLQLKSICWTSDCGLAASSAWYLASAYCFSVSNCSAWAMAAWRDYY